MGITGRVSTYCQPEAFSRNGLESAIFTISKTSNINILGILGMVFSEVVFLILFSKVDQGIVQGVDRGSEVGH